MTFMKNTKIVISSLLAIFLLTSCVPKKEVVAEADIQFFYLELCPSCNEYVLAENLAEKVLSLGGKALNIIHDDDAKTMKSILTEKHLADISHVLPLLVIENEYFVGYEEIADTLDKY